MFMENFEDKNIEYVFGEAKMCFARVTMYNSPESIGDLYHECEKYKKTFDKTVSRLKRGMRIPKTWIATMHEAGILVQVLENHRVIFPAWAEAYRCAMRRLNEIQ